MDLPRQAVCGLRKSGLCGCDVAGRLPRAACLATLLLLFKFTLMLTFW